MRLRRLRVAALVQNGVPLIHVGTGVMSNWRRVAGFNSINDASSGVASTPELRRWCDELPERFRSVDLSRE
jgi:hypothetical protein